LAPALPLESAAQVIDHPLRAAGGAADVEDARVLLGRTGILAHVGFRQDQRAEAAAQLLRGSFSLRDNEQLFVKFSYRFEVDVQQGLRAANLSLAASQAACYHVCRRSTRARTSDLQHERQSS
jgi:hypothetical protein